MKKDIVFTVIETMLANSPEASYKRLNPALRSTLVSCIEADLPFQPDTFRRISDELRGGWWFGDGAGSHHGERFYTLACEVNHTAACISFENFAKRPAVLWEENVKTPERLHVGSQFSWQGHYVTVTSMRKDSLVACTYTDHPASVRGLRVGAELCGGWNEPTYVVTHSKKSGATFTVNAVEVKKRDRTRKVSNLFTIPYADICEFRRTSKATLKVLLSDIAACNPDKESKRLTKAVNAGHFPHWQLEAIRSAFTKRKAWKADQGRVEAWRNGENGAYLDVRENLLRVRGDRVECSNGNGISRAAAERALPVVLARRKDYGALALPLDGYQIDALKPEGVKIGCTLIAWPEVDILASRLQP